MYGVPALKEQPEFSELKVLHKTASVHGESVVESVRLTLPSGVIVDISCCPSSVLSMLVGCAIAETDTAHTPRPDGSTAPATKQFAPSEISERARAYN